MPVIIDGTLGVNAAAVTTTSWNPTNLSIPGNATIGDASSDTLTINGASVTFAGTATRIKADFSNDTIANQALFQTTGTNYSTQLRAIPNGSGTQSGFFFYGSSDIDNSSWGAIRTVAGTDVRIQSHTTGSGALLPITFMTGTTERVRIDTDGKVAIGAAGAAATQLLTVKGRFNSDTNNNYYGAWGEGNTATGGYSFLAVGEWHSASAYFQKKEGQSYSHIYTYNSSHNLILQGGSGVNGETTASGNVGIGLTNPTAKLEVAGIIRSKVGQAEASLAMANDTRNVYFFNSYNGNSYGLYDGTAAQHRMIYYAADNNWAFHTGGSERLRLTSSGDVWVGTGAAAVNALRYFDIQNADTGSSAGVNLRLITSNSSGTGNVAVDMVKYKTGGFIINNNDASGVIAFNNAGAERMRITTAGNVGIGTDSPSSNGGASGRVLQIHNPSTGSWAITHYTNGNTGVAAGDGLIVGMIGTEAYVYSYDATKTIISTAGVINMNLYGDGLVELPYGKIKFPASQSPSADANTLDDYEEGNWTPTNVLDQNNNATTWYNGGGSYIKIGRLVYLKFRVHVSSAQSEVRIYGLPFASDDGDTGNGTSLCTRVSTNHTVVINADHIWVQGTNDYDYIYGMVMYRASA